MKYIPLPGRLSKRSASVVIVIALIGVVSLFVVLRGESEVPSVKSASDIPLALATSLADLSQTTLELDKSLDAMPDTKADTYDRYLTLVNRMNRDCKAIRYLQQSGQQFQVEGEVNDMLEQNFRLCTDVGNLTAYTANQYRAVAPMFQISDSLHRYESFGPLAAIKKSSVQKAFNKSQANLQKVAVDPQLDYSSSDSLKSALTSNAPAKDAPLDLAFTKLTTARRQIIAQRVNYWRSQVAIGALRNAEQQRMNDSCSYLTRSNVWPKFCPKPE